MPITLALPQFADLIIDQVQLTEDRVVIEARAAQEAAACPDCGHHSQRHHSHYRRVIADLPLADRRAMIVLRVRRFRCGNQACTRVTFAEQVPTLAARYARRSRALLATVAQLGLVLGGRPGQRFSQTLRLPVGRMTLLRAVRALPEPAPATPRILGVDDFALARGQRYGTILLDLETRRPIDVLADRTAATLAAWLVAHPGVTVICRDRGGSYAEGARQGAPTATQVADRFHLIQNLTAALVRLVTRLYPTLKAVLTLPSAPPDGEASLPPQPLVAPIAPVTPPDTPLTCGTANQRARHAAVQELVAREYSLSAIARSLRLDRKTVRRYARCATPPTSPAPATRRRSLLDPYTADLARRWQEGCRNAALLWQELRAAGYRGSATTVRAYLAPFRDHPRLPAQRPLAVRTIVTLLIRRPAALTERDQQHLTMLRSQSAALSAAHDLAQAFATLVHERRGAELQDWVQTAKGAAAREFRAFAEGLERDWEAVVNGLTLIWNSGPVEGHVNKLKVVKRQMFGRAKLDLLRRRVLLAG